LNGVREPATQDLGYMPAFKYALNDAQIAELATYMRSRFAPGEAAWGSLPADIARLRKAASD
jgi:nicotinate dehydrogenase subunit B